MGINQYRKAVDMETAFDSGTQRYLFLEMAYRCDYKGVVRLPQTELASLMLVSVATVKREMGKLQEMALITREGHGRYRLSLQDEGRGTPLPELIAEELAHLNSLPKQEGIAIGYNEHGWPILIEKATGNQV